MVDMVDLHHHHLEEDDPVEDQGSSGVDAESDNNFTHARYHLFLHWQPEDRMGLTVLDRWLASSPRDNINSAFMKAERGTWRGCDSKRWWGGTQRPHDSSLLCMYNILQSRKDQEGKVYMVNVVFYLALPVNTRLQVGLPQAKSPQHITASHTHLTMKRLQKKLIHIT